WTGATSTSNYTYWYGCTTAMQSDANTDFDCYTAYGYDNGLTAPNNFASTAYSNPAYYANTGGTVCPDSWHGDGHCDLCLIAKYGYDAKEGSTGADDCVNKGAGTTNSCYDLAYNGNTGVNAIQYLNYSASH
ncbi:MAG: hypothetical protein ABI175_16980, partial [Polyangiales bacterium]